MTHTTTHKKAPGTCDSKGLAVHTTSSHFPMAAHEGKAFATLVAGFALAGHTLTHSNPADGAWLYYAARCGKGRALPDLQTAARFMVQIGGGHV